MDEPETPESAAAPSESAVASSEGSAGRLVGTVIADRYRVDALLGEGAMGAVFRAQHVLMQKNVALKVLHRETSLNAEVVKRFEREAVAAGRVMHPHVAAAQDFGQLADGSFYLVLEYVAGKSLRQLMEEQGALDSRRAIIIAEQVASALAAAHAHGIVHRDLKPENVMLVGDAEGDFIKVLDFGLAKLGHDEGNTDTKLTKMGAIYGTPQYMAPEQASGGEVDHRADLYALGIMLYEMLKGEPPFTSDQMVALLVKHMTEVPPPLPAGTSPELSALVMSLLEKRPEARPASAEALVAALHALLPPGTETYSRASLASFGPRLVSSPMAPPAAPVSTSTAVSGLRERLFELGSAARQFALVPVNVAGRAVPRGALIAAPLFCLLVGAVFWPTRAGTSATSPTAERATENPSESATRPTVAGPADPELARVLDSARLGSDSALYALEQRKDAERSGAEWLALSQARLMRRNVDGGLEAFRFAIESDKRAAEDETILGALRALTKDEKDAPPILHFAADRLGAVGADFLFYIWAKTSAKNSVTTLAYDLLDTRGVKAQRSDALRVAMSLREAKDCSDYLDLLPDIEKFGDQRSIVKMRDLELEKTHGCGPSKRDDCYPCLREGTALRDATQQAAMRAAPQFELSRRFRFLR